MKSRILLTSIMVNTLSQPSISQLQGIDLSTNQPPKHWPKAKSSFKQNKRKQKK